MTVTTFVPKFVAPLSCAMILAIQLSADESDSGRTKSPQTSVASDPVPAADAEEKLPPLPAKLSEIVHGPNLVSMNPEQTLFLNRSEKKLFLRTQVACRDCTLEMLCCQERTKEHESILSFRGAAMTVHAGLLAIGAKPGKPVSFNPEFTPPRGQAIEIFVNWIDKAGKPQRVNVRHWLRHTTHRYFSQKLEAAPANIKFPISELRYDPYNKEILWFGPMSKAQRKEMLALSDDAKYRKAIEYFFEQGKSRPMTADFVFAGSFHFDQDLGEGKTARRYAAEAGFLICVANFAESVIDVREKSSASDGGLSYEGWTERIPPEKTPVLLELGPVEESKQDADGPNTPQK